MNLPVAPTALRGMLNEIAVSGRERRPLVVGGARELAGVLRRELGRGAQPGAVSGGDAPEGAAVLVYVLGGEPRPEDEEALRRARRARVPIIGVVAGPATQDLSVPHVLATDLVRVPAGEGFPLGAIARAIADRLGEDGAPLAASVPLLRRAVGVRLVETFALRNAIVGAAVFLARADLPLLALNEVRLVLRLSQAYGLGTDARERLPELAAVVAAGFGLRETSRGLIETLRVPRFAVQAAVAYAGTRVLGEAASLRLARAGVPRADGSVRQRPVGVSPAAP